MSLRIFNLAKQLSVESKDVIDACQKLGLNKKSAFNTVNDDEIVQIGEYLKQRREAAKATETSQSYFAVDRSATGRQPALSNSNLTGKVRRLIMPARGRIGSIDPTAREIPAKPTESPAENANLTPAPETKHPETPKSVETPTAQTQPEVAPVEKTPEAPKTSVAEEPAKATAPVEPVEQAPEAEKTAEQPVEQPAEPAVQAPKVEPTPVESPVAKSNEAAPPQPAQDEASAPSAPRKSEPDSGQDKTSASRRAAPLRHAMERRGSHGGRDASGRDGSGRDSQGRGGRGSRDRRQSQSPAPSRPAPVTSSFISQLEADAQKMEEMKRPPIITTGGNDRVRVLGQTPAKPKEGESASAKPAAPRVGVGFHLAPIPAQAPKPQKPAVKEPAAQKPEKKLSAEILRAATSGGAGPLTERIRAAAQSSGQKKSAQTGRGSTLTSATGKDDSRRGAGFGAKRNDRMESNFSDGKSSNKKNRGGRDRDDNGREDRRGS